MEIIREMAAGGWLELRVTGRLDSYWAGHFKTALGEVVRDGAAKLRLNLSGVTYLSSAGIAALLWGHKQLASIRGKLVVAQPSEPVKEALEVTGLTRLLTLEEATPRSHQATTVAAGRTVRRDQITLETFTAAPSVPLTCRLIGDPAPLLGRGFGPDDCRTVRFPATSLGIGLGALGRDFSDCRGRFGEFVVAAGTAAYLPTDGTRVPDYLLAAADAEPEMQVCYGLLCEGPLPRFVRFAADQDASRVPLSNLLRACLDLAEADRIGFALLADTAGLMGAALRRSPVLGLLGDSPFTFPGVRDWLSFTSERAHLHSTALVVGIAVRGEPGALAPLVRPIGNDAALQGHCHAAALSYQPVPRGEIDLRTTVASLFEQQTLQSVLHLLADHRDTVGLGESEFVRGACWFGAIGEVVANRS